jgi:hypothetical protein
MAQIAASDSQSDNGIFLSLKDSNIRIDEYTPAMQVFSE